MIKMFYGFLFKFSILVLAGTSLMFLSDLVDNLGNGRYQFKPDSVLVMDTKTGQLYRHDNYGRLEKFR